MDPNIQRLMNATFNPWAMNMPNTEDRFNLDPSLMSGTRMNYMGQSNFDMRNQDFERDERGPRMSRSEKWRHRQRSRQRSRSPRRRRSRSPKRKSRSPQSRSVFNRMKTTSEDSSKSKQSLVRTAEPKERSSSPSNVKLNLHQYEDTAVEALQCLMCKAAKFKTLGNFKNHLKSSNHASILQATEYKAKYLFEFHACESKIFEVLQSYKDGKKKESVGYCRTCNVQVWSSMKQHKDSIHHKIVEKLSNVSCCGKTYSSFNTTCCSRWKEGTENCCSKWHSSCNQGINYHYLSTIHLQKVYEEKEDTMETSSKAEDAEEELREVEITPDSVEPYNPNCLFGKSWMKKQLLFNCSLCKAKFAGNITLIEDHCKTREHYDNYKEYLRTKKPAKRSLDTDDKSKSSKSESSSATKTESRSKRVRHSTVKEKDQDLKEEEEKDEDEDYIVVEEAEEEWGAVEEVGEVLEEEEEEEEEEENNEEQSEAASLNQDEDNQAQKNNDKNEAEHQPENEEEEEEEKEVDDQKEQAEDEGKQKENEEEQLQDQEQQEENYDNNLDEEAGILDEVGEDLDI